MGSKTTHAHGHSCASLLANVWQKRGTSTDATTMSHLHCLDVEYSVQALQNEPPTNTAYEYDCPQQHSCSGFGVDIYTAGQHDG